jgi:hypothetical protein
MRRAVLLAALFALGLPMSAQAEYDPIGSGTAALKLDPSFAAFLKRDRVSLSTLQGARGKGSSFTLPAPTGNLDPTTAKGEIDTEGTLVFKNQRKKVPLRNIVLKTQPAPLVAKVGGSQLKLATSQKRSFTREGFSSTFEAKKLKLTAKLATRLNKKLRPKIPFAEGQLMGTIRASTEPLRTTILEQNRATLVFDPGFVKKLDSLFVSLNPIFPAEHVGSTFSFPIVKGGALAPDASQGTLRTGGDVELLQLGGGQIFWHEPWLDLGAHAGSAEANIQPSPPYGGKLGRISLFDALGGSVSSDRAARTISVSNLPLTLQASTAKALNEAFDEGKEAFRAGEAVGTMGFSAVGQ